jgi:hypothetical protein
MYGAFWTSALAGGETVCCIMAAFKLETKTITDFYWANSRLDLQVLLDMHTKKGAPCTYWDLRTTHPALHLY